MSTVLSILVLAAIAMLLGAAMMWRKGDRKRAMLMVLLAIIAATNVAIWTLPDASGEAPISKDVR
jgi:membrane protein DedA with SNARE-associated domain